MPSRLSRRCNALLLALVFLASESGFSDSDALLFHRHVSTRSAAHVESTQAHCHADHCFAGITPTTVPAPATTWPVALTAAPSVRRDPTPRTPVARPFAGVHHLSRAPPPPSV
jgi:hypothetical protein